MQMRNSEESLPHQPVHPLSRLTSEERREPVLPVRAWCDQLDTPALGIRNIGATPHGRVGAEIVCDDTLVQYAAYWLPFLIWGGEWYHSIPIILVGMALHLFFSGQFSFFLSVPFGFGLWKNCFWRLC